jgi:hypothetical protein
MVKALLRTHKQEFFLQIACVIFHLLWARHVLFAKTPIRMFSHGKDNGVKSILLPSWTPPDCEEAHVILDALRKAKLSPNWQTLLLCLRTSPHIRPKPTWSKTLRPAAIQGKQENASTAGLDIDMYMFSSKRLKHTQRVNERVAEILTLTLLSEMIRNDKGNGEGRVWTDPDLHNICLMLSTLGVLLTGPIPA